MCCLSLRRFVIVIAFAALAVLLAGPPGSAQVGGGKAKGKKGAFGDGGAPAIVLPDGLRHVPMDAVAFVHVRIADSLNGAPSQALLKRLRPDGEQGKLVAQIETRLGVRLADLESVTVFAMDLPGNSTASSAIARKTPSALTKASGALEGKKAVRPSGSGGSDAAAGDAGEEPACLAALTYGKPVDRKAVLRALAASGDAAFWPNVSAVFLSDRCVLFGNSVDLLNYTARVRLRGPAWDDGPGGFGGGAISRIRGSLSAAIAKGAEPHLIVAGIQVPAAGKTGLRLKQAARGNLGAFGPLLPLLNTAVSVTVDMRDAADISVRFYQGDDLTLEAVESLRTLTELTLDANDGKMKSGVPIVLDPEIGKALRKGMAGATINQVNAGNVEVRLRLEVSPDELAHFLAETAAWFR
jgi:hypothetical protein